MADFNIRSDSVNVEQIMEQVRARIRDKRGLDYTEEQIRQLASVKLEKFLDPRGVRSDLLDQFRRLQSERPVLATYPFEEDTLYETHRAPLRWIRRLLRPLLKLFFNPNAISHALHLQSRINDVTVARRNLDQLYYEVLHNLVIEITRTGIEVKNLKMRVESLASRLEFTDRRSRALESVVVYKGADEGAETYQSGAASRRAEPLQDRRPSASSSGVTAVPSGAGGAAPAAGGPNEGGQTPAEGPGQRSRRRRRRRGRRGGAPAASVMASSSTGSSGDAPPMQNESARPTSPAGFEEPDDAMEVDVADHDQAEPDQRDSRPEPVEQAFGAEAHPAEPVANDPDTDQ
jgi:hypothetical protein